MHAGLPVDVVAGPTAPQSAIELEAGIYEPGNLDRIALVLAKGAMVYLWYGSDCLWHLYYHFEDCSW